MKKDLVAKEDQEDLAVKSWIKADATAHFTLRWVSLGGPQCRFGAVVHTSSFSLRPSLPSKLTTVLPLGESSRATERWEKQCY